MRRFKGIGASQGIAIGRLAFFENFKGGFSWQEESQTGDAVRETARLNRAIEIARQALDDLRLRVLVEVGKEGAMIIEVQRILLDDADMYQEALGLIEYGRCTAEYAVQMVGKHAMDQIACLEDSYLRERTADVRDLTNRLQGILQGQELRTTDELGGQYVVASTDFLPSTMVQIDPLKVLAVICRDGSEVSHAAIIARSMGIPSVLQLGRDQFAMLGKHDTVVVDGFRGELVIDPDERTLTYYRQVREQYLDHRIVLKRLRGLPSRTVDGMEVVISADISRMADLLSAAANDTLDVGLFRGQMILSEELEQREDKFFSIYREMLQGIGRTHRMTVRTMPLGEEDIQWSAETAVSQDVHVMQRMLDRNSDFAVQLRGLLRAAAFGKLAIVTPGIERVQQMETIHAMLQACLHELKEKGLPSKMPEIGILVETAQGAEIADQLVWMGDFFLADIDALTRHTVMEDHLGNVIRPYDAHHPMVTRAIQQVTEAAARRNLRCGVCGQAATDLERVEAFLAMGISEFVVPPLCVLEVREKVREIDLGRRQWQNEK